MMQALIRGWMCGLVMVLGCAAPGVQRGSATAGAAAELSADQLVEVADVLAQHGETVRAEQYYVSAIQRGAPRARVLPALLRLYVRDGQYRLAIEHVEDQLRREPRDTTLRLLLGTLYTATGQVREAVASYERVLEREPRLAEAHYALATVLYEAQVDRGRADSHFRAYLTHAPDGEHAAEARSLLLTEVP